MVWAEQPGRTAQEVEHLLPRIRFPLMTQPELQAGHGFPVCVSYVCVLTSCQSTSCTDEPTHSCVLINDLAFRVEETHVFAIRLNGRPINWWRLYLLPVSSVSYGVFTLQLVCDHPMTQQSTLLHDLICEAMAAHQDSQDVGQDSQVMLRYPLRPETPLRQQQQHHSMAKAWVQANVCAKSPSCCIQSTLHAL